MTSNQKRELEDLKDIINQEIQSYNSMQEKMHQKKALLIEGNAEGLLKLDQEMLHMAQKLAELEQRRMTLLVQMGQENKSLQDFIRCLDIADARPFIEARQRLLGVIENVKALNDHNRSLLDLSLKWIENSVGVIASILVPEGASYTDKGGKNATAAGESSSLTQSTVERSA